jgi:pseudouridine synthase
VRDLSPNFKEKMEGGVDIDDYITKPCTVKILGKRAFAITLTEGKKHQIRRMVAALENEVAELERTRVMNITLAQLKPGTYRTLAGAELATFLKSLSL